MIAQAFDPSKFTQETSKYLAMKESEKKIVNFFQCLILLKQENISEFLKDKLCLAYTQIELKHRFKDNAIYYLLTKFDPDAEKILRDWSHKKSKQRQPAQSPKTSRKEEDPTKSNRRRMFLSPGLSPRGSLEQESESNTKTALEI